MNLVYTIHELWQVVIACGASAALRFGSVSPSILFFTSLLGPCLRVVFFFLSRDGFLVGYKRSALRRVAQ